MSQSIQNYRISAIPAPFHPEVKVEELFSDYGQIDLEIGSGTGLHAISYCRQNPTRALIALERTSLKFQSFQRKLKRGAALPNLLALREQAERFCVHQLPNQFLSRVFILYPNPYPKKRQANKRWHNSFFMEKLRDLMKPNAELILASNLGWYLKEAEDQFTGLWGLRKRSERNIDLSFARTAFERKYLMRGETCSEITFVK